MKKLLSLMIAVAFLCGTVVGCSDDKKPATPPAKDKAGTPAPEKDKKGP